MNKKRIIAVALVMGVLFGGSIAVSAAGENYIPFTFSTLESGEETVEGLNSIGRIQGKESEMAEPSVILDSTELVILAKAANQLNTQFTMALADAVKGIGSDISIQDENNYSSIIETINGIEERQGGTFDTSNMTESGTIGQEDYEASLVIPLEKGYYPDGSQVTVNLTDNNKSYYNQGYAHGIADGLDKVDVKYIYHEHSGDSTTGTGCYTVAEYHKHTDSCYKTVQTGTRKCGTWNCYNNHTPYADFRCSGCGAEAKNQWVGDTSSSGWGMGDHMVPIYSKQLNCTKGDEIIGYQLGCGKTEESIESAIITF